MPDHVAETFEAALLQSATGFRIVDLGEVRNGARGISARGTLLTPDGHSLPAFLKLNREDEDCFRRESEAVGLIAGLDLDLATVLLVDPTSRLIVWEDLGVTQSLGEILQSENKAGAETTLAALTQSLAALHLATRSPQINDHSALRARAHEEAQALRQGSSRIASLLVALGEDPPNDLEAILDEIASDHETDSPFVALTHGDQAPSNVLCKDAQVWLVDFEYAAFRPMLYDLSAWSILCPLPMATVTQMLSQYRAAVSESIPLAKTEAFGQSWGATCAFRALSMAVWFGNITETNGLWGDTWDKRSALTNALERAAQATLLPTGPAAAHGLLSTMSRATARAWTTQPVRWPALES